MLSQQLKKKSVWKTVFIVFVLSGLIRFWGSLFKLKTTTLEESGSQEAGREGLVFPTVTRGQLSSFLRQESAKFGRNGELTWVWVSELSGLCSLLW